MASRYGMDPRAFRDMSPDDFMFMRYCYTEGTERRRQEIKANARGIQPVVMVGG